MAKQECVIDGLPHLHPRSIGCRSNSAMMPKARRFPIVVFHLEAAVHPTPCGSVAKTMSSSVVPPHLGAGVGNIRRFEAR